MTAAKALKAAQDLGIRLGVNGDRLKVEAACPAPDALIALLKLHKIEIIALLLQDTATDWEAYFDRRAEFFEIKQNYPRLSAEIAAFEECIDRSLALNPPENVS